MESSTAAPAQSAAKGVPKITFNKNRLADFYPEVKRRVDQYFTSRNISRHANGAMIAKTTFIITMFVATYVLIISNLFAPWLVLLLAITNGFFTALIGLNVTHDAIHGSFSSKNIVNKAIALWFNVIGANDYMWKITHNIVHHTFTNIPHHDEDIELVPILRLNPEQELWKMHKYQHIYAFLLYPLTSLSWVFLKDYRKYFQTKVGNFDNTNHPKFELFRLIAFKIVYYTLFLVIPFTVINLPWYQILFGFVILHFVEGITLALVFQLAHTVEGTSFPVPDDDGRIDISWAAHQMYTTADFARKNPAANFLFGGLNFQIEHHLFPKVCHIHYSKISPIVEQTAKDFNLPYIENKTFLGAIRSHVRILKTFGRAA